MVGNIIGLHIDLALGGKNTEWPDRIQSFLLGAVGETNLYVRLQNAGLWGYERNI